MGITDKTVKEFSGLQESNGSYSILDGRGTKVFSILRLVGGDDFFFIVNLRMGTAYTCHKRRRAVGAGTADIVLSKFNESAKESDLVVRSEIFSKCTIVRRGDYDQKMEFKHSSRNRFTSFQTNTADEEMAFLAIYIRRIALDTLPYPRLCGTKKISALCQRILERQASAVSSSVSKFTMD